MSKGCSYFRLEIEIRMPSVSEIEIGQVIRRSVSVNEVQRVLEPPTDPQDVTSLLIQ